MRLEERGRMWLEVTPLPSASRGREQAVKIMEEAGEVFAASDRLDADLARWIQVLQLDPRAWMAGEKGRMLEDEIGTRMKDVLLKHLVRDVCKPVNAVRRIGKDNVELLTTYVQELEHVVTDNCEILHTELSRLSLDEVGVKREHLYTIDHRSPSGSKLI